MLQQKLLEKVITFLNNNHIDYMVTGSIVSSIQGEPRRTHIVDIIVVLKNESISMLLKEFESPRYYLNQDSILKAISNKSMFNIIYTEDGDKIDFWLLTNDDFDVSRFERKVIMQFQNINLCISTPEDTIVAKLKWSKLSGGSQKPMTDALRVYEINYKNLDLLYINEWVQKLSLQNEWNQLLQDAEPLT